MFVQDADRKLQDEIYNAALAKAQFDLPDAFLKRWLRATNEKITDEELEGGYNDFAKNLKWTLIENKIMQDNSLEIKYEDVIELAKVRLDQQFRMYSQQSLSEEQLSQYAVQYLQNKDNMNKIAEEVKALMVFDFVKNVVTLDKKEISNTDFGKL